MTDSHRFTAKFSLFSPEGNQVFFAIGEDDSDRLLTHYDELTSRLSKRRFDVTHPDLKPGEKIEQFQSWVKGRTKMKEGGGGGNPCVYLYSQHDRVQWRTVTVWEEDIDKLPFADDVNKADFVKGGAPEKDTAKLEGDLHMLPGVLEAVLYPTDRKTSKGNVVYRFSHVKGYDDRAREAEGRNAHSRSNGDATPATPAIEHVRPKAATRTVTVPFKTSGQAAKWAFDQGLFATFPSAEEAVKQYWADRPVSLQVTPVTDDVKTKFMEWVFENFTVALAGKKQ